MKKRKRTIGEILGSIIRGLITLILTMILVMSVTVNILFYREDAIAKIDFMDYHRTFFVNNCNELGNIDVGALVIADHTQEPQTNRYIICTVGSGYKTVLALNEIIQNENGSISYKVSGSKENSTVNHIIPATKYIATVLNQNAMVGDLIAFMRGIPGIVTCMAIPSFLLILLSVSGIRRNRSRYDDDLLEAEILAEELRKAQNEEKRISEKKMKERKKVQENRTEEPLYNNTSSELLEKIESSPIPIPTAKNEKTREEFEEEINKKAIEIKKALHDQAIGESVKEQVQEKSENIKNATENIQNISDDITEYNGYSEPDAHPVYRQEPVVTAEPVPEKPKKELKFEEPPIFTRTELVVEKVPEVVAEPPVSQVVTDAKPKVKKTAKRVTKKLDADSIDDLIKLLDSEKKKLD